MCSLAGSYSNHFTDRLVDPNSSLHRRWLLPSTDMASAELSTSLAPSPPSASRLSTPRLPLELLVHIIHQAIITHLAESHWAGASACCLISKPLLPFAQEALYHTVLFRGEPDHLDKYGDPLSDEEVLKLPPPPSSRLINTLHTRPHLAKRVVRISLDLGMDDWHEGTMDDLSSVVKLCPNIQAIHQLQGYFYWEAIAGELPTMETALTSLQGASIYGKMSAPNLIPMDDLVHLGIKSFEPRGPLVLPPFKLRSFALGWSCNYTISRILRTFLEHSHSSLRRLSIAPGRNDWKPLPDLSPFTALRDVVIQMNPRTSGERHVPQMLESTLTLLKTCANLNRFELVSTERISNAQVLSNITASMDFFPRLPPSLTTLDVRSLPLSLATLLAYLAAEVSPSLRRLDAGRFENEEERTKLEEACWERGVELYTHVAVYQYNNGK